MSPNYQLLLPVSTFDFTNTVYVHTHSSTDVTRTFVLFLLNRCNDNCDMEKNKHQDPHPVIRFHPYTDNKDRQLATPIVK